MYVVLMPKHLFYFVFVSQLVLKSNVSLEGVEKDENFVINCFFGRRLNNWRKDVTSSISRIFTRNRSGFFECPLEYQVFKS